MIILDCEPSCYEEYANYRCSCLCYGREDIFDFPECIEQDFKVYPEPVICEPSCYPLGDVEPCNCLCYQEEIDYLELDCNDDENFWEDFRDDYFLRCEPACYQGGSKPACSCLCYADYELPQLGQNCIRYDGPQPIYYGYYDDFVQYFHCDPECWEGNDPNKECDCICFNADHQGGDCMQPPPPGPLTCEPACYDDISGDDHDDSSLCSCLCYPPEDQEDGLCTPYADVKNIEDFYCDDTCWNGQSPTYICDCICFREVNRDNCFVEMPYTCEPACYNDDLREYPCDCGCYNEEDTTDCVWFDHDVLLHPPNCKPSCYSNEDEGDSSSSDNLCDCICFQLTEENCINSRHLLG